MSPLSVPKIFLAGGITGFGYYLFMRQYWFPNPYKTQGVQNIEDRFSSGGGHPTHTPGTATQRGTSMTPIPLLHTKLSAHKQDQSFYEGGQLQSAN